MFLLTEALQVANLNSVGIYVHDLWRIDYFKFEGNEAPEVLLLTKALQVAKVDRLRCSFLMSYGQLITHMFEGSQKHSAR